MSLRFRSFPFSSLFFWVIQMEVIPFILFNYTETERGKEKDWIIICNRIPADFLLMSTFFKTKKEEMIENFFQWKGSEWGESEWKRKGERSNWAQSGSFMWMNEYGGLKVVKKMREKKKERMRERERERKGDTWREKIFNSSSKLLLLWWPGYWRRKFWHHEDVSNRCYKM